MASKIVPDQLAMHFRRQLNGAEVALDNGDWQACKDVCLRLRINPTVGIYARARLNLLLARIHKPDDYAEIYAYECIDLLDLYRQDFAGKYDDSDESVLVTMENTSKDIIDDIARERAKPKPVEPASAPEKEDYTVTVFQSKPRTDEELAQMARDREKYEVKVEGYLRRAGNYRPLEKYVPLSREEKKMDEDEGEEKQKGKEKEKDYSAIDAFLESGDQYVWLDHMEQGLKDMTDEEFFQLGNHQQGKLNEKEKESNKDIKRDGC